MDNKTSLLDLARRILAQDRSRRDSRDALAVHLPRSATLEFLRTGLRLIQSSVRVLTLVNREHAGDAFADILWRQIALRGIAVERIYVLPHRGFSRASLQTRLDSDQQSGIKSHLVLMGDVRDLALEVRDSALLDNSLIITFEESSPTSSSDCTVSARSFEVEHALEVRRSLLERVPQTAVSTNVDLQEPLVLSADLLNGVAPVLCTADHIDTSGCAWYHGAWQYLRLLNLVSTPTWHDRFYRLELERAFYDLRPTHVVITGTADYSVLAYVIDAAHKSKLMLDISVIDLCPTPLFACKWYSKRAQYPIHTIEGDILNHTALPKAGAQVVITDAFLTRFQGTQVEQVLDAWKQILTAGGRVITTVRNHQKSPAIRTREDAILDFRERAREGARTWRAFLGRSSDDVADLAELYARRMISYASASETPIQSRVSSSFKINTEEEAAVPGELQPTTYTRLVLEKR